MGFGGTVTLLQSSHCTTNFQGWGQRVSSLILRTSCAPSLDCAQLTSSYVARFSVRREFSGRSLRLTFPPNTASFCTGSACNGYLGSLPDNFNNNIMSFQLCMGGMEPRTLIDQAHPCITFFYLVCLQPIAHSVCQRCRDLKAGHLIFNAEQYSSEQRQGTACSGSHTQETWSCVVD